MGVKYVVKTKPKLIETSVEDMTAKGEVIKNSRLMAYLIIDSSTDNGMMLLKDWLPDTDNQYFEMAVEIGTPIDSPCRVAIRRGNNVCRDHHLVVMTKGVEDDFVKFREILEGKPLPVTILPEDEEDEADNARDSGGDYDVM